MSEYVIDYESVPLKWRDGYGLSDIELTEEIVRCKDCKWFIHDEQFGDSCRWWCRNTNPDGFCHGGDRKVDR